MKIAVTGALGHIGSMFVRHIASSNPGHELRMLDNLASQRFCSLFDLPIESVYRFRECDVREANLEKSFHGVDAVVHLAATTDAANSFSNPDAIRANNLNATKNVAIACAEYDIPLIFASSTSVYGSQESLVDEQCSNEDLRPQSPYAESKLAEERWLSSYQKDSQLRFVILRLGTICGPSPGMRFHTAVNKFCWQASNRVPITVWTTAIDQKRPYLDLTDCCNAFQHVIEKQLFDGHVYNVVTENLTVRNIIESISKPIPDLNIEYVDHAIMNQLSYEVCTKKIEDSGFNFSGNIKKCIDDTLSLLRSIYR